MDRCSESTEILVHVTISRAIQVGECRIVNTLGEKQGKNGCCILDAALTMKQGIIPARAWDQTNTLSSTPDPFILVGVENACCHVAVGMSFQ